MQKGYSSVLSFTVADINNTVTKLMALGAELDGPIKYEIHGKVSTDLLSCMICTTIMLLLLEQLPIANPSVAFFCLLMPYLFKPRKHGHL